MVDHSIFASIRGSSGLITLSPALIAEYFLLGIDNFAITKELASHWTREHLWDPSTGTTLVDLISTTRRHFLTWCQATGNRNTMELLRKQAERDEDILLGLSTMRTCSSGAIPWVMVVRVSRFRGRGRGGHFRGHKGRGTQYF
ncbi:hypothetical protein P9112_012945 [Eukaryota sp. TZLM1-RC]